MDTLRKHIEKIVFGLAYAVLLAALGWIGTNTVETKVHVATLTERSLGKADKGKVEVVCAKVAILEERSRDHELRLDVLEHE